MKSIFIFLFILLSLSAIFSCKKDKDEDVPAAFADSEIRGTIKTPSGKIVGSAQVIAGSHQTVTDHNGSFILQVPNGPVNLIIQTGRGKIFKSEVSLNLISGSVLILDSAQSVLKQTGTLAHTIASFDNIQSIIFSLGYNSTQISYSDLFNLSSFSSFDALFLNCTLGIPDLDSVLYTNLSSFLINGGSIYASDYAVDVLNGDGNWRVASGVSHTHDHTVKPGNAVPFATCMSADLGGFIEDSSLCTAKTGDTTLVTGAIINDPAIINMLGHSTVDIHYNAPSWEQISICDAPFTPVISDPVLGPLAVRSSSFGPAGGIIFYTTFHNEPQGAISTDVRDILQYFILNL